MTWMLKPWATLDRDELYAIMVLRQRVFVVEQRCAYLDADEWDAPAQHLWCGDPTGPTGARSITGYCRIFSSGVRYAEASVGRVVTSPEHRKIGLGRALMARALEALDTQHGRRVAVRIHAQAYLQKFYASFGFERDGDDYLEDEIVHLDMVRRA